MSDPGGPIGAVVLALQGPSRAPQILAGNIIPEAFATIFFFGRVYARLVLLGSWGIDDTVLSISWLASFVLCVFSCLATKYGSGHHETDIPSSFEVRTLQLGFVSLLLYQISLGLTKLSICLFYARVFTDKTSKILIRMTMAVIILYTTPTVLFSLFQCKPISGAWNRGGGAVCAKTTPAFWANGVCNIVLDAWLIALIIPRVWGLQMVPRAKIALYGIITSGWLVIVAAIVRMVKLSAVFATKRPDVPWVSYDVSIWTGLEVAMGIFCVSAPAMKPIMKKFAPGLMSTISGYGTSSNRYFQSKKGTTGTTDTKDRWTFKPSGAIELGESEQGSFANAHSRTRSSSVGRLWKKRDLEEGGDSESTEELGIAAGPRVVHQDIVKRTDITIEVEVVSGPNRTLSTRIWR